MARKISLVLIVFSLIAFLCFTKVEHFQPGMLVGVRSGQSVVDPALLYEIAKKPLCYIGNGAEAIAFISSDGKYVLKFFLTKKVLKKVFFKPKKKFKQLFCDDNEIATAEETLKKYEEAFTHLADETGLVGVHSAPVAKSLPTCQLIDYLGKVHEVDLNETAFVIQKKAKIVSRHMSRTQYDILNKEMGDLFARISGKGFISLSRNFNPANFGMLDGKAVIIDVGKLEFLPDRAYEREEKKMQSRYSAWLRRKLDLVTF